MIDNSLCKSLTKEVKAPHNVVLVITTISEHLIREGTMINDTTDQLHVERGHGKRRRGRKETKRARVEEETSCTLVITGLWCVLEESWESSNGEYSIQPQQLYFR